jgi:hypothetical protein
MDEDDLARARSALTDEDPDLRIGMAYVMGQLGPELGGPLLPQLLPLVNDPEPAVRGAAIISLRAFATDAGAKQKLREVLRPLLGDQDAEVRWAVLDTLHEVDPGQEPDLVDAIAALVRDEDQSVRSAAVRALGAAGPNAAKHLPAVVEFFLDDPAIPPFGAAETVLRISPLTPVQLTSVLYPLYVYPELTPLTRATAYAASGGDKDGLLIVRLLGRARVPAKDIVRPSDAEHAATVLRDALGATLLHQDLEAEIGTRIGEIEALR